MGTFIRRNSSAMFSSNSGRTLMSMMSPAMSTRSGRSAREIQQRRYVDEDGIYCNAQMSSRMLHRYAVPDAESLARLKRAMERLNLSARAYDRILKVARTIADLDASSDIRPEHISEAIGYRTLDRGTWGESVG